MGDTLGESTLGDGSLGQEVDVVASPSTLTVTTSEPSATLQTDSTIKTVSTLTTTVTEPTISTSYGSVTLSVDVKTVETTLPSTTINPTTTSLQASSLVVETSLPTLDRAEHTRYLTLRERLIDNNPNAALRVSDDRILNIILTALARTIDEFTDQINEGQRDLFVATATGNGLDKRGREVNVRRATGENDGRFRQRVKAGYGRATSDTTIEDFAVISTIVLQADKDDIELEGVTDKPVVRIRTDVSVVDESFFTESEIVDLLNDAVPSGHNVEVLTIGTFEFDGPNYSPSANSGFNQGSFGGKLS